MLSFVLRGDILTVKETLYTFADTRIRYTSYNISTWKTSGCHTEPDKPCVYDMVDNAVAWVKQYYLPKVI